MGCKCSKDVPEVTTTSHNKDEDVLSEQQLRKEAAVPAAAAELSSPAEAGEPRRADLSGVWRVSRLEGDMDGLMKEAGFGVVTRTAAFAMGYGLKGATFTIVHVGDDLEITTGTYVQRFRLDGSEQRSIDNADGLPILARPAWEPGFGAIRLECTRPGTGQALPTTRRFFEGDLLCVEQTAPSGLTARRYCTRVDSQP